MPVRSFPSTSIRGSSSAAWAAALLFMAGCAGTSKVPAPTAKHVELAGRNGQVTTLGTLKVGRSLYIGRCGACHSLKEPGYLTPAEWPEMVGRMAENAKVNEDQQRAITQYLVAVSAAVHEGDAAPPPDPAAGTPPAPAQ
jgi:mono/diheme cytochrome c family protein